MNSETMCFWQIELGKMLVEMGQSHLFQQWADPGVEDDKKKSFFAQVSFSFSISLGFYSDLNCF